MDSSGKITKQDIPELIEKHVPGFKKQTMKLQPLMGMTNLTMKITNPEDNHTIVFRRFSGHFDRKYENQLVNRLSQAGVAPKCYFSNEEYRIQQYINNARHPQCKEAWQNQNIMKIIVEQIYKFHQTTLPKQIRKRLFTDKMFEQRRVSKIKQTKMQETEDQQTFQSLKKDILQEYESVKKILNDNFDKKQDTIKLCHNDLNNLNIFIQDQKTAKLIDFQYTRYNYVAFDIANFLNEFCFDYSNQEPGFVVNRSLTLQKIQQALKYYPEQKYQNLAKDVLYMLVICNFFWAVWSLNIARTESSPAFLPLEHGKKRMQLMRKYRKII